MKRIFGKYRVCVSVAVAGLMFLSLSRPCHAQTKALRSDNLQAVFQENMSVSLVPLPLFFNGFRVDFDCRLKDRLWLQVAPQYNYRRKGEKTRTDGFCLDVNARYYVFRNSARGFYIATGLGLDYNQITESSGDFPDAPTKGKGKLKRHQGNIGFEGEYSVDAFRFGAQVQLGWQISLWPRTVMDFYIGAAFRHSFNSYSDPVSEQIGTNIPIRPWMYQFSGVYMQAGIRIGLML